MSSWLLEELESDPSQWRVELMKSWSAPEFKNCIGREAAGRSPESSSEDGEEYNFVSELGVGPSSWIDGGY